MENIRVESHEGQPAEGEGKAVSRGKNRKKEDSKNGSTEREGGMYVEMGWETIETERKAS